MRIAAAQQKHRLWDVGARVQNSWKRSHLKGDKLAIIVNTKNSETGRVAALAEVNMFTKENVTVVAREMISQGFLKIFRLKLTHPLFGGGDSEPYTRELMERGNAVAVVLYDEQRDKVVMVEQFRIGALDDPMSPWLLEFPAGIVKEGERDEEVAIRECEEEVGRAPASLHKITKCYLTPGGSSEKITILYGLIDSEGLDGTIKGLDCENEDIRVRTFDFDEALQMTRDGRIRNASTTLGLYWLAGKIGQKT